MVFLICFFILGCSAAILSYSHNQCITTEKNEKIERLKNSLKVDPRVEPTLSGMIRHHQKVREYEILTTGKSCKMYGLSFESLENCHIHLNDKCIIDTNKKIVELQRYTSSRMYFSLGRSLERLWRNPV